MHESNLISVIIPIYNSENYLDQCLESICGQTFRNLEIILIYDISSDQTLKIAKNWAVEDGRIRIVENTVRKGLGAARNQGLVLARGDYIVYADADDWLDRDYIDTLYREMKKGPFDCVSSTSIYMFYEDEGGQERLHVLPAGIYDTEELRKILLLCDYPSVWKKLIRRTWLLENELFQPETFSYEDWGYKPTFILNTLNMSLVEKPGVHYRLSRHSLGSTTKDVKVIEDYITVSQFFLDKLEQKGQLWGNIDLLRLFCLREYYFRMGESDCGEEGVRRKFSEYQERILIQRLKLDPRDNVKSAIVFGGFSARWEVQFSNLFCGQIEHFCFSGLVSAMSAPAENTQIQHKQAFRKDQVERDVLSLLKKRILTLKEPVYFFIDFVEERWGAVDLGNEQYAAASEAFYQSETNLRGRKIDMTSDEYDLLWKAKCVELVDLLNNSPYIVKIIVLQNRLSNQFGTLSKRECYPDSEIDNINASIGAMERYFCGLCNSALLLKVPPKLQFTDHLTDYGIEPQYMNQAAYTSVGYEIFKACRTIKGEDR